MQHSTNKPAPSLASGNKAAIAPRAKKLGDALKRNMARRKMAGAAHADTKADDGSAANHE